MSSKEPDFGGKYQSKKDIQKKYYKNISDVVKNSLQKGMPIWDLSRFNNGVSIPKSYNTGGSYPGINSLFLMYSQASNKETDSRWATKLQLESKGIVVPEEATGVTIYPSRLNKWTKKYEKEASSVSKDEKIIENVKNDSENEDYSKVIVEREFKRYVLNKKEVFNVAHFGVGDNDLDLNIEQSPKDNILQLAGQIGVDVIDLEQLELVDGNDHQTLNNYVFDIVNYFAETSDSSVKHSGWADTYRNDNNGKEKITFIKELSTVFLAAKMGITPSSSYKKPETRDSWCKILDEDHRFVVRASGHAQVISNGIERKAFPKDVYEDGLDEILPTGLDEMISEAEDMEFSTNVNTETLKKKSSLKPVFS